MHVVKSALHMHMVPSWRTHACVCGYCHRSSTKKLRPCCYHTARITNLLLVLSIAVVRLFSSPVPVTTLNLLDFHPRVGKARPFLGQRRSVSRPPSWRPWLLSVHATTVQSTMRRKVNGIASDGGRLDRVASEVGGCVQTNRCFDRLPYGLHHGNSQRYSG